MAKSLGIYMNNEKILWQLKKKKQTDSYIRMGTWVSQGYFSNLTGSMIG